VNPRLIRHLPLLLRRSPLIPKLVRNYYRLLVRREPVLRSIDFATTFSCVCHCAHCYSAPLLDESRVLLSLEEKKRVLDEALDLGAVAVNFVGGEPLCDPDIVELMAHIPAGEALSVLTTNGVQLDERLLDRLIAAGLSILAVSIDDLDAASHDLFRGRKGTFRAAVRALEAGRSRGLQCIINTSITEAKLLDGRAARMESFARSHGAAINLSLPSPVGRWAPRGREELGAKARAELDRLMQKPHVRWDGDSNWLKPGCGAGVEKISITAYGDVLACGLIHANFGNLRERPLREAWGRMLALPEFHEVRERCPTSEDPEFARRVLEPIEAAEVRPVPYRRIWPDAPADSSNAAPAPPRPLIKLPRSKIYFSPEVAASGVRALLDPRPSGEAVAELEQSLAARAGRRYGLACASGRLALWLALQAVGARPGQGIVVPSYTCRVILPSLLLEGLRPQFADVRPGTYNLDPASVERVCDETTRFLLLTHIHGQPTEVEPLLALAERRGWTVIEDAAAAYGATVQGRPVGAFGPVSYTSLSMYKPWNALGGGALFTDDSELLGRARTALDSRNPTDPPLAVTLKRLFFCTAFALGTHPLPFSLAGWPLLRLLDGLGPGLLERALVKHDDPESPTELGPEYAERFTDLMAEIGLSQLARADADDAARRANSAALSWGLRGSAAVLPESEPEGVTGIALNYVVRVPDRERVIRELRRRGVDAMPGYVESCSALPGYESQAAHCPVSKSFVRDKLYLPNHPPLSEKQMRYAAEALRAVLEELGHRGVATRPVPERRAASGS